MKGLVLGYRSIDCASSRHGGVVVWFAVEMLSDNKFEMIHETSPSDN